MANIPHVLLHIVMLRSQVCRCCPDMLRIVDFRSQDLLHSLCLVDSLYKPSASSTPGIYQMDRLCKTAFPLHLRTCPVHRQCIRTVLLNLGSDQRGTRDTVRCCCDDLGIVHCRRACKQWHLRRSGIDPPHTVHNSTDRHCPGIVQLGSRCIGHCLEWIETDPRDTTCSSFCLWESR